MTDQDKQQPIRVQIKDVERLVGVHRQTIWRWYSTGSFPKPHHIGRNRFWILAEVKHWLEEQINAA
ncbi:MAG: AlpA family phage regulatory protein [Candidatus Sedimenticola sp. (ex Thyasira tokunagai)]